jgi:hypothetical protein
LLRTRLPRASAKYPYAPAAAHGHHCSARPQPKLNCEEKRKEKEKKFCQFLKIRQIRVQTKKEPDKPNEALKTGISNARVAQVLKQH